MRSRLSRAVHWRIAALATVLIFTATCTGDRPSPMSPGTTAGQYVTPTGLVTANPPQVFIGAGDIASCSNNNDEATAQIIDTIPGTVYVLGDNVYPNGTNSEYANCYDPTWGRFKARTKPSAGNHDYNTNGATGYYNYFGAAAGDPSKGYYSYELGAWHIIVLNSNISRSAGSAQDDWLIADLAAHPNQCLLSYFHHPLYSSTGGSGSGGATYSSVRRFWDDLYAAGTDLVLGGHRHFYERLAPTRPDGTRDDANGIREIIVGSGGIGGGNVTNVFPTSEVRDGRTFGVLKLYLYDDSYAWKFIPVAGETFTDSGSTACHSSGGSTGGGGSTVSSDLSTVTTAPDSIAAGGATSTVTVTAKDANGDPVAGVDVTLSATGTGNTIVQPANPTDANGVATGTLSSTVAEDKTVSATADGVSLTPTATVTVTPGPVSDAQSTVTASPTSITEGTGTATITVTAKDANGNLISGATVTLAATGSGNTVVQPADTTDDVGVATGTFSSTVSEPKTVSATIGGTAVTQTATVIVNPPGVTGTITHTLLDVGNNSANGKVYTTASISPAPDALVTVAILSRRSGGALTPTVTGGGMPAWVEVASEDFDTQGSPQRRLTIFRAMSSTPGSGPITITYQSSVSNAQWIVSQWQGVETSGANGSGAIAQVGGTASDGASSLLAPLAPFGDANDVAYGAVGVKDNGPLVTPGSGFTAIAEQSSGEKSSLAAEWATNQSAVGASWSGTLASALLATEIKAGGGGASGPTVDADQSTVSASPTAIAVGGETSTITITARDAGGVPVSGVGVIVTATGSGNTLTGASGTTSGSGQWTATLSSTIAEDKVVSAVIAGVPVTQTATVTVNPPGPSVSPSLSTVDATLTSLTAGGSSTINVTVLDDGGNPMSGVGVTLSAPGASAISQPAATDAAGMTSGDVSATQAGTVTVTATAAGTALDQQPVIQVIAGPADGTQSTLVAAPPSITEGSGSSTITVTVKDQYGNPVDQSNVQVLATGTGNTVSAPSPTDLNGVTTATLSSTVSEVKHVSASADGTDITQTADVTVNPPGSASTITHALLTSGHDVTNQRVYTTAPITPAPNTLVTVAVTTHRSSAAAPEPTLSGGGMTNWDIVATVTYDPVGAEHKRVTIYRAMSAAPGSGPITITSSATVSNCQWIVSQWAGVETSGTNGSGAIVQTGSTAGDAVSGLTTSLAPFGSANNVAYGVFGIASTSTVAAPGSGFTAITEEPSGEGTPGDVFAEWATNLNAITASWTSNSAGALGVEIKAGTGP